MAVRDRRRPEEHRVSDSDSNVDEQKYCIQDTEIGEGNMRGNQRLNHDDMNVVHLHFYSICNERGWKSPVNPTEFDWVYLDVDNHIVQARIETPARGGRSVIHLHPSAFSWENPHLLKGLIHHELVHWVVGPTHAHDEVFDMMEKGWKGFDEYKEQTKLFSAWLHEENGKWVLTCPNCGKTVRRNRKPASQSACRECCIEFNNGLWSDNYTFHIGGDDSDRLHD